MKTLLRAILFACALCAAAPGLASADTATTTLTVETSDGALLLMGSGDALADVQDYLAQHPNGTQTAAQIRTAIKTQFPDAGISITLFVLAGAQGQGVQRAEVSVRRALLRGLLPPIEGLPAESAQAVLSAAGFRYAARDAWDAMSRTEQLILAARDTGPLVVLAGTGPHDPVLVIYVGSDQDLEGAGE